MPASGTPFRPGGRNPRPYANFDGKLQVTAESIEPDQTTLAAGVSLLRARGDLFVSPSCSIKLVFDGDAPMPVDQRLALWDRKPHPELRHTVAGLHLDFATVSAHDISSDIQTESRPLVAIREYGRRPPTSPDPHSNAGRGFVSVQGPMRA